MPVSAMVVTVVTSGMVASVVEVDVVVSCTKAGKGGATAGSSYIPTNDTTVATAVLSKFATVRYT
ncbi:MAG: hypothetical protein FJ267_14010 [Planctomycetes bacterium]|nr:hypothetical protein [Planctomycetota bacterium]